MPEEQEAETGVLATAAKAIGKVAGKIASLGHSEEVSTPAPKTLSKKVGKLPPSNKSRLPRKEKKRLQMLSRKQAAKA